MLSVDCLGFLEIVGYFLRYFSGGSVFLGFGKVGLRFVGT